MTRPDSPYVGLRAFTDADWPFFFGRSEEAAALAGSMLGSRATVLYGPPGSGKSSVIGAALTRVLSAATESEAEFFAWSRWQPGFEVALADAVATQFREGPGLHAAAEAWSSRTGRPLFLLLDQFEEYFRYAPDPVATAFANDLALIVNARGSDIHVLLSLRDDSLALLDRLRVRMPELLRCTFELRPLGRAAARQTIVEPLAVWRDRGLPGPAGAPEEELVTGLIAQADSEAMRGAAGTDGILLPEAQAGTVAAPFLQLTLQRLWETEVAAGVPRLRLETLDDPGLGGVAGVLRSHVAEAIATLDATERESAARMVRYLVTPSGAKNALSAQDLALRLAEEEEEAPADASALRRVLETLARPERRILTAQPNLGRSEDGDLFELFHDALAPPLLGWARERRQAEARRRAEKRTSEQAEALGKARARLLVTRVALFAALGLLLATIIAGIAAHGAAREAAENEAQTRLAVARRLLPESMSRLQQGRVFEALLVAEQMIGRVPIHFENQVPDIVSTLQQIAWAANSTLLDGHTNSVLHAAFSPDGRRVVTASTDGTARVWDLNGERTVAIELKGHSEAVRHAAFSPDGRHVVTASSDNTARVWDLTGERPVATTLVGHTGAVWHAAFSPDGRRVVTVSADSTARVWDPTGERPVAIVLEGHRDTVLHAAFSPDGRRVVTGSNDRTARVWDLTGERPVAIVLEGHGGFVLHTAFSPDGRRLLTVSEDGGARIWAAGERLLVALDLGGSSTPIRHAAFSPDGLRLLAVFDDGATRQLGLDTERPAFTEIQAPSARVWNADFSPDARRMLSVSVDGRARLHQLDGGRDAPKELQGHREQIRRAVFSPDGRQAVTASLDGTVRVWDLDLLADPTGSLASARQRFRTGWSEGRVAGSEPPGCLSEEELVALFLAPRPDGRAPTRGRTAPRVSDPPCAVMENGAEMGVLASTGAQVMRLFWRGLRL